MMMNLLNKKRKKNSIHEKEVYIHVLKPKSISILTTLQDKKFITSSMVKEQQKIQINEEILFTFLSFEKEVERLKEMKDECLALFSTTTTNDEVKNENREEEKDPYLVINKMKTQSIYYKETIKFLNFPEISLFLPEYRNALVGYEIIYQNLYSRLEELVMGLQKN